MLVLCVSSANLAFSGSSAVSEPGHSDPKPRLKLRKRVEPVYPEQARMDGLQGTVVVELLVNKQGEPEALHTLRGDPVLARAVTEAVLQWRWQPYRLNRNAVAVDMTIAVNFELR
ncbi:MAG TPA: energy transducer TonB [Candidatus Angelobacter sp.]|nr:energy transducer TonB [Candidatus Angelobacter sp.]